MLVVLEILLSLCYFELYMPVPLTIAQFFLSSELIFGVLICDNHTSLSNFEFGTNWELDMAVQRDEDQTSDVLLKITREVDMN